MIEKINIYLQAFIFELEFFYWKYYSKLPAEENKVINTISNNFFLYLQYRPANDVNSIQYNKDKDIQYNTIKIYNINSIKL